MGVFNQHACLSWFGYFDIIRVILEMFNSHFGMDYPFGYRTQGIHTCTYLHNNITLPATKA